MPTLRCRPTQAHLTNRRSALSESGVARTLRQPRQGKLRSGEQLLRQLDSTQVAEPRDVNKNGVGQGVENKRLAQSVENARPSVQNCLLHSLKRLKVSFTVAEVETLISRPTIVYLAQPRG